MTERILVADTASGFGEETAIELARHDHSVIAGVQIAPQKTELMEASKRDQLPVSR